MKTLRRLSAATILSVLVSVSVFAGHIETPGAPAPPTNPAIGTSTSQTTNRTSSILLMVLSFIYR